MAPCCCESLQTQQHASQLHRLLSWLQTCSRSACCLQSALPASSHGPAHSKAQYKPRPKAVLSSLPNGVCLSFLVSQLNFLQHVPTLTYLVQAVERFGLRPTAAAAHIAALAQLTASRGEAKVPDSATAGQKQPQTTAWGSIVLQGAEEELGRFVEQVPVLSSVVS